MCYLKHEWTTTSYPMKTAAEVYVLSLEVFRHVDQADIKQLSYRRSEADCFIAYVLLHTMTQMSVFITNSLAEDATGHTAFP
ncbi:unnamed protein product [Cylicocyclus nassatus]|uniref:Uncharacterized protein n=1 Tax=Cylicocyclus nassatus TaxID=53992 RepID=A0AA36M8U9_CYLNA|nr:unnamed protein product [Cylicocyclus nassatus]